VQYPGAFGIMSREITLLPSGEINDPASGNSWTLKGKTLVLRWADRRAPGGFWVDTCTVQWDIKGKELFYNGENQTKMRAAGHKGKLPPWFEKARQDAPAYVWEPCLAVPDVFWSEKARKEASQAIGSRNARNAETRARNEEEWRRRIEAAGREASRIWNQPGPPGPTANELTRKQEEERFRQTGGRMGTSPGFK